jgi:FMN-dependent oxidoreductase (nitrilotriacetate monooxygenase family)
MQRRKPIVIGLALAGSWLSKSGWRRDDSAVEEMHLPDMYLELAKRAEAQSLHFLFRPDTQFLKQHMLATEPGFSSVEPISLLSYVAAHTRSIGLVATLSTSFFPPYIAARQLQSLQWMSRGRAGWNIVTALDGQQNFGIERMPSSEQRYAIAQEYVQVVKALWDSYPASAIKIDRETGEYADPSQVEPIDFQGQYFSSQGPINTPTYPQGRVALFQAGASEDGRTFAAQHADAIFAAAPDISSSLELRDDLRRRAISFGRDPDSLKILPGLSLFLAETREQAQQLFIDTHRAIDNARLLQHLSDIIGVDVTQWSLDTLMTIERLPADFKVSRSITHAQLIRKRIAASPITLGELIYTPEVMGSAHWLVVGTSEDAVSSIVERVDSQAIDGFIAIPGGSLASMMYFFDQVIPQLKALGLAQSTYRKGTLVDKLK